jgi:hypothetical protein
MMATPVPFTPSPPATGEAPTATLTPQETKSPTSTPTRIIPQEARLEYLCIDVLPELLTDTVSSGVVVLQEEISTGDGTYRIDTFLRNMETGDTIRTSDENERQWFHAVSPDRKSLAYRSNHYTSDDKLDYEDLNIVNGDDFSLTNIPWEDNWYSIPGWLGNNNLVITLINPSSDEQYQDKPSSLLLLNTSTGERQILRPDFPNIYDLSPIPYMEGWSMTHYDPTLSRVVYFQRTYEATLWDLQNRKQLATWDSFYNIPRWSPDGSQLVVENPTNGRYGREYELFLISRDGQMDQLTNLNIYNPNTVFLNYSWSPDGRYIAAWLANERNLSYANQFAELAIIDVTSKQVMDTCIIVKYSGNGYGGGGVPLLPNAIWSPDGKQLLIRDWYEKDHKRAILVDPEKGSAAVLADNMEPLGWMSKP